MTYNSVYDIPIKSWDNKDNFLSQFKGKVTLLANVTANCGNAPQLEPLEKIYQTYKDRGFEVVAIPTNDFCGPDITYGDFLDGITCGAEAKDYAVDTYGVTFQFSEMVVSKPNAEWREKRNNTKPTHDLFEMIASDNELMGGNFEKWLIDRDGKVVKRFPNFMLLDYLSINVNNGSVKRDDSPYEPLTAKEAYELICSEIEKVL